MPPIDPAKALPLDLHLGEAQLAKEVDAIWHRDWVFACPVDVVAEPGMYVPVTIGHQPVIVLRNQDHQLVALANVCAHRGTPLIDQPGKGGRLSCPYHGWSYADDGALVSVPYAAPDEIDLAAHCLPRYRAEAWNGLVFVSLEEEVEPLDKRFASIEAYVKPLAIARLFHWDGPTVTQRWEANWKLVATNAVESYHLFRVHPETVEPVTPTDGAYYLAGSARATVTGGESEDRADYLLLAAPPSFVAVVQSDVIRWRTWRPDSPTSTLVTFGEARMAVPDPDAALQLPADVAEDRAICERAQTAMGAIAKPGSLTSLERPVADFNRYLAWRLNGVEPARATVLAPPGGRPPRATETSIEEQTEQ